MIEKDSTKTAGEIDYDLYLRQNFSSERQTKLHENPVIPESRRFYLLRHGTTFNSNTDIIFPEIKDDDLFGHIGSEDAEIKQFSGTLFDSKNEQLLTSSHGSKESLKSLSANYSKRQEKLESIVEGVPPIRSLLSSVKLVSPTLFYKIFVPCMVFFAVGLIFLEWGSQATMMQSSGDEAFLGEYGYMTAVLATPILIMMTLAFKAWFSSVNKNVHQKIQMGIFVLLAALGITYFVGFSIYYGGLMAIDEASLDVPPEFWKQVMIFSQLGIGPLAALLIFIDLEKRSHHYSEEKIFYSKEHLASDEELSNLAARRQDNDTLLYSLEGFEKAYEKSKNSFESSFLSRSKAFNIEYDAAILLAKSQFITSRNKVIEPEPVLKIVGGK